MFNSSRCSLHRRAHKVPQLYKQDHLSTQADVDDGDYGDDVDAGDDGNQCIHSVRHVIFVILWRIYIYTMYYLPIPKLSIFCSPKCSNVRIYMKTILPI